MHTKRFAHKGVDNQAYVLRMGKSVERQAAAPSRWPALLTVMLLLHAAITPANGTLGRKKPSIQGPIKTVVILVMENRSFDHMLGWLKRLNPEIDGLNGNESNPILVEDPDSIKVRVSDDSEFIDEDPGHSFQAIREQIFGSNDTSAEVAPMNGFAQQAENMLEGLSRTVMSGFRPEVVPVYTALAMEFAVFDRWFASVPSSTQPNRLYIHSATSYGAMSNVKPELVEGFPQKTIFDSVHEAGLSFGIYYQNIPATLFLRNLRKIKYASKFHQYSLSFKLHAKLGLLPNLAVIEQRYFDLKVLPANDDHPSHDVSEGQKLVKEIYETLRASPQWNEMLFVITYDEHGGFFDHVPTPLQNVPSPDDRMGPDPFYFEFDRLGVRVPTIMVSPWINKGTVVHEPDGPSPDSRYEHSSLPATIRKIFGLDSDFLTKRDAWAGTFESILYERNTPRTDCPDELPGPPWTLRHSSANENAQLSEFQEELVQLASQLNGDYLLNSYPNIGKSMNVKQANGYVEEAVAQFLEEGRRRAENGSNDSDIVKIEPLVISRKMGPVSFAFSKDS